MRIGLVTPYDLAVPGGVNKHVLALAREFIAFGHHVRVLAPASENVPPEDRSLVVPLTSQVITIPFAGSTASITLAPQVVPRLRKVIAQEKFDILHLHEPLAPLLPLTILRDAHLFPETRIVGTFHAYRERPYPLYAYLADTLQRLLDRLDGRIAVSEPARWFARAAYGGTYRVIPNGVDWKRFARADGPVPARLRPGRPTILFVGRGDPRKGLSTLLEAFGLVKQDVPDARLVVVGPLTSEEHTDYILRLRNRGVHGVLFIGPVPEAELPGYYRAADVFCAPSTGFESFGIVLVEAMAAGTAVVASCIAGYRYVIQDGVTGVLVPPGDHYALAHALTTLLQDPARCRALGEAAREAARIYDWPRVAQQVLAFYEEVLSRPRTTAQVAARHRRWTEAAWHRLLEELREWV